MALNELTFNEKMDKLNSSQQSIENTSTWCGLWRKDARVVASYWEKFFVNTTQAKRLAMIYLANDVLQNSRKKGPEFITEFFKVMPRALRHFLAKADDKGKGSVMKVIRVWEQRRVFGSSGAKTMRQIIEEAEGHPPSSTAPPLPHYAPAKPHLVPAPSGNGAAAGTLAAAGDVPEDLAAAAHAVGEAERAAASAGAATPHSPGSPERMVERYRYQIETIRVAMEKREEARAALQAAADAQAAAWQAAATELQAYSARLEAAEAAYVADPKYHVPYSPDTKMHEESSPAAAGEDNGANAGAAAAAGDASTEEAAALAAQLMENPQALLEAIAATLGGGGGAAERAAEPGGEDEEEEYDPENPFT